MSVNIKSSARCAAVTAEVLLAAVLQGVPFSALSRFGGTPVLLISLSLSLTACLEEIPALAATAACGILADYLSGTFYFAPALTVVCYFCVRLFSVPLQRNLLTLMTLSAGASALLLGGYFLLFRLGQPESGALFLSRYLPRMAATWVCTAPFYGLNRLISGKVGYD